MDASTIGCTQAQRCHTNHCPTGVAHPALMTADQLELLDDRFGASTLAERFGYGRGFGVPSPADCDEVRRLMNV